MIIGMLKIQVVAFFVSVYLHKQFIYKCQICNSKEADQTRKKIHPEQPNKNIYHFNNLPRILTHMDIKAALLEFGGRFLTKVQMVSTTLQ